jgi:hypothetical protein
VQAVWRRHRGAGHVRGLDAVLAHRGQQLRLRVQQPVGNAAAMAAPPHRSGTHDRAAAFAGHFEQAIEASAKGRRQRVVGVVVKARAGPEGIDLGRHRLRLAAPATELGDAHPVDAEPTQAVADHVLVELRVAARARHASAVDDPLHPGGAQQADESLERALRMADRGPRPGTHWLSLGTAARFKA